MVIKTKFNIDDKVWVLTPDKKNYMFCKVVSFDITNRCNQVEISYNIDNRFFDENLFRGSFYPPRDWKTESYLTYREKDVYKSISELLDVFMAEKDREIIELKELKKGIFRL